jgi:hypothetical protein
MKLRISPQLSLPEEAVTRSFGILGMRGSGKSNAAVVLAEEMFKAGLHWVAIDPKGDWWGIRSSTDSKGPGLPIVIFGGEHQDVPLEPTAAAGVLVADLILTEGLTCVLDLGEFTKGEKIRFLAGAGAQEAFAERLFRKKKRESDRVHIFLEEAHDYVPQKATGDVGKMVDAVSRFQTMGRTRGIGCSVLSQRSARVHKDILTQVDTLVAFRTVSPQDRDAIEEWVKGHGLSKELIDSLPGLADGESWMWSPEWLQTLKRIRWRRRDTYDSASTPGGGTAARRPATLADVDLGAISEAMAATIERVKADDPKELKRQLAEARKAIRVLESQKPTSTVTERIEQVEVKVPVFRDGEVARLEKAVASLADVGAQFRAVAEDIQGAGQQIGTALRGVQGTLTATPPRSVRRATPTPAPVRAAPPRSAVAVKAVEGDIPGPQRKILSAIAQYPEGRSKRQVAIITGYSHRGGGFNNPLSWLRARGYVEGKDTLRVTDPGLAALGGEFNPLPHGQELFDHWMAKGGKQGLGKAGKAILSVLYEAYPGSLSKAEVAAQAGYAEVGGGFNNPLSRLRTLGLVTGSAELRASDDLFN